MKIPTLRALHKWTGLIVGVQLLLWTVSGLVFALLDHDRVAGAELAAAPAAATLGADEPLVEPAAVLAGYGEDAVRELGLRRLGGRWVYRVAYEGGVELRDARDGSAFAVDQALARGLALSHYRGDGRLSHIRYHAAPTLETRGAGASWQAEFDDPQSTSLYFSAQDGALIAARGDSWRLFDVFWMLHTMDYAGRDDFNNPVVILVAFVALWIGLTGTLLLIRVFWRRPAAMPLSEQGRQS